MPQRQAGRCREKNTEPQGEASPAPAVPCDPGRAGGYFPVPGVFVPPLRSIAKLMMNGMERKTSVPTATSHV